MTNRRIVCDRKHSANHGDCRLAIAPCSSNQATQQPGGVQPPARLAPTEEIHLRSGERSIGSLADSAESSPSRSSTCRPRTTQAITPSSLFRTDHHAYKSPLDWFSSLDGHHRHGDACHCRGRGRPEYIARKRKRVARRTSLGRAEIREGHHMQATGNLWLQRRRPGPGTTAARRTIGLVGADRAGSDSGQRIGRGAADGNRLAAWPAAGGHDQFNWRAARC